ncbi:pentatricopeptide repeat-containing protein At5g56310 [Coffea arabica]|uniref:Pentatricopeptide repeat-containing protein At5g56310 n=1 Tax=Coffea arabica TaxID=13443 RepID=A0A6P6UL40_COFAR|nr:pentatricopeptide repeat-containing protein At5g56310-like [Coffea arabica]
MIFKCTRQFSLTPHLRTITSCPLSLPSPSRSWSRSPPPPPPPSKPTSLSNLADQCLCMHQLKQIHAQMIITGRIRDDNYAASRLLAFCSLSDDGDLNHAFKIFSSIQQPNSFMWNTLIRALASSPTPQRSLSLFVQMRRLCIAPGKHTFPFVLKACSNLKSLCASTQIHVNVLKFGLDSDLHVANGLIRAYSVSGCLSHARKLFDQASVRNLSIWTTMISGYAQSDCGSEAIQLFHAMITHGFEPNGVTLASVLSACAQSGGLELGGQIHSYMQEKGIEFGVILGTALVNMYARNGAFVQARQCFASMQERNIATWNSMICGLAVHGHAKEALDFFKKLEQEKVRPSDITFIGVLSACCHAGLFDFGGKIFHSMSRVYGIQPKIEHYSCMVDLLGRSGKLLEAEELIKGMKWKADVVIWGALLTACKNFKNTDVAERVGKEILALDPHNHGVYVVLSNMYAEAGRWEDVVKLRKFMKEGRMKKTPGWSLVDGAT